MAKDVYFKNVPPHQDETPPERTTRGSARRTRAPVGDDVYPPARERRRTPPRQTDAATYPPYEDRERYASPAPEPAARSKKATKARPQKSGGRQKPETKKTPATQNSAPPPKKKKHIIRKFFLFLLVLLLICGGLLTAAGFVTYQKIMSVYTPAALVKSNAVDQSSLMHDGSVYNILLMGVDQADADAATRSDSMILLSVDKRNNQLKLTTFMRDMYVTIPGYGETKLNHACMYEGPQLTVASIELNFGVRIDAYAKIGYDLFIELVNGVGGITVAEIDDTESRALAEEGVYKDPGTNIYLTGEEAIKYVRIRHWQSDFDRTERQREVITLIIDRAKKTSPQKLMSLAQSIASKIECSVQKEDLLKLALEIFPCLFNGISQQQIPADGTWSDATRDGLMVLLVDFDQNKAIIKSFIYGG